MVRLYRWRRGREETGGRLREEVGVELAVRAASVRKAVVGPAQIARNGCSLWVVRLEEATHEGWCVADERRHARRVHWTTASDEAAVEAFAPEDEVFVHGAIAVGLEFTGLSAQAPVLAAAYRRRQ